MNKEQLHHSPEHHVPHHDLEHESRRNLERIHEKAESAESQAHHVEALRHAAEAQAISGKEMSVGDREQPKNQPVLSQRELKADAYRKTLQKIRRHLTKPERKLDKVIHQPTIEALSNATAKTVARPSGLLGAGIVSLAGSSFVLYMAKHYGFRYNFFMFFMLFAAGYVLGSLIEVVIRLFAPRRY